MRLHFLKFDQQKTKVLGVVMIFITVGIIAYFFSITRCQGNCTDGLGTKSFLDGNTYIGHWRNGRQDGYGLLLSKDKKIIYNGKWNEGEPAKGGFQLNSSNLKRKKNE